MKLKKFISAVCIFSAVTALFSIPAFAYSENHVNKQVILLKNKVPSSSDSPTLYIKIEDFQGEDDLQFKVLLDGPAKWIYSGTHNLSTGLSLFASSETELIVTASSDYVQSNERISIPLFAKATGYGYISAVIDPLNSEVSAGEYQFASCGSGSFYIEAGNRPTISGSAEIDDVVIKDTGALPIEKGTVLTLKLSNGYSFTENTNILLSGKFSEDNTEFKVNADKPSEAFIKITKETPSKTGAIILNKAYIETKGISSNGPIEITLSSGTDSRTSVVAIFESESEKELSEAKENKEKLIFIIGDKEFRKDDKILTLDAAPYINSHNYTMVPVRAAAEAFGIDDVSWDKETKTVSMTNEAGEKIRLTIGKNEILVNDTVISASAAPEITNSRTFLPLRALASVLGVSDENISYDSKFKTVTIIKD